MRKIVLALSVALVFVLSASSAWASATWTFETSFSSITGSSTTLGPLTPESGSGSATGVHASAATWVGTNAGNGSVHSWSVNTWAVGDYFQFVTPTGGASTMSMSWDQTSSNTGPGNFTVSWSNDNFATTAGSQTYSVLANLNPPGTWSTTIPHPEYGFTQSLTGLTAANVTVRLTMSSAGVPSNSTGTFGSGGTDRVDNVAIVPEPTTLILGGLGLIGLLGIARNRRSA